MRSDIKVDEKGLTWVLMRRVHPVRASSGAILFLLRPLQSKGLSEMVRFIFGRCLTVDERGKPQVWGIPTCISW